MAEAVVEGLEMIDVGHHQGQWLVFAGRVSDSPLQRSVEIFSIGELRERISQTLGADGLETYLKIIDFFL